MAGSGSSDWRSLECCRGRRACRRHKPGSTRHPLAGSIDNVDEAGSGTAREPWRRGKRTLSLGSARYEVRSGTGVEWRELLHACYGLDDVMLCNTSPKIHLRRGTCLRAAVPFPDECGRAGESNRGQLPAVAAGRAAVRVAGRLQAAQWWTAVVSPRKRAVHFSSRRLLKVTSCR